MLFRFSGLWRHADFLKLWSGQTISVFGSMIGGTALTFTAILFLDATPMQMSLLNTMQMLPAFLVGLFAGALVDRLRRRPLMIGVDIGRALALATIPLAALLGFLHISHLYVVALAVSVLTSFFDLAYQSYLPTLIGKESLIDGNSKLSASAAVAEFGGFSIGGWLVQIFTAPLAILLDAVSFLVSALSLSAIRAREVQVIPEEQPDMRREIAEGLREVWHSPLLRSSALILLCHNLAGSMYGALVVLYMSRVLGFDPGVLGMIWAVGGISSLVAASQAPRITRWLGPGWTMSLGLLFSGISSLFVPLASGATFLSAALLVAAQLGDGFYVVYDINQVSLRQGITSERLLGRVNATMAFLNMGAALLGALLGGALGEWLGVRPTLFLGGALTILAAVGLAFSPLRRLKTALVGN